jgi:AcrR family transcriptional regulator
MSSASSSSLPAPAPYLPGPERRRRILGAAKRVFARRGYHDTNISHICEELKIARGTLYQYFESKREVFAAIVEDLLARLREAIDKEPRPELPPGGAMPTREQVIEYCARSLQRVLGALLEDEEALRIVMREAVGLDGGIDAILRAMDDIVVDRFAADIALVQSAGIFRADVDPRSAALYALGGIQKLALHELSRGTLDVKELSRRVARLELVGLLSPSCGASAPKEPEVSR